MEITKFSDALKGPTDSWQPINDIPTEHSA
jgi:hypothetical protein